MTPPAARDGWHRSDRFNRPQLVPVAPSEPSPPSDSSPLRVRLGQAMCLNGTVPRGADLRNAIPRLCKGCGALFIILGKGSARALYCQECRAKKCPSCNGVGGQHYPYCSWVKARPCRGCGVELGHGGSQRQFCEPCWAQACPECGVRGGRHQRTCLYEQRDRRPGLTERYGVVTEQEILDLYLEHRDHAVRIARGIVGADAEDAVHDVTAWLLEKRDYLRDAPGAAYFLTAVKHTALRRLLYAWARLVVAVDPETLVIIEAMTHPARTHRKDNTVRV